MEELNMESNFRIILYPPLVKKIFELFDEYDPLFKSTSDQIISELQLGIKLVSTNTSGGVTNYNWMIIVEDNKKWMLAQLKYEF